MYAIIDIETTGSYAAANGITEVAVYIHDGTRVVKHFETLVNPQQSIPRYITALTGIDNEAVADAPVFDEIADMLFDLLQQNIFVAHNVNFDYSFIKHQLKNSGYDLTAKKICTVRLGRKIFPGLPSYSLGNLCRSLNIDIANRHRAGGDAKATVRLFEHYLAHNGEVFINDMLRKSSKDQWLPLHVDKTVIDALPQQPGVYYFHNSKGKVVYVGKAINIKKRVSSHFTHNDGDRKRQNFLRNIHQITYKECANELEALVFESTEIKRLWPLYNRSQKQPVQQYGLYLFEDAKGYMRLAIDKKKKNLQALYMFNLLHEGIVMLQKIVEQFDLNSKLCFLDKTPLTKKDYEFLDAPLVYNGKIKMAVTALNEQLPTFALVDNGMTPQEKLCLLIERGSFWGMGYIPEKYRLTSSEALKNYLQRYADNDYIRNSIYSFAEANPEKKIVFSNLS
jgi:DNA polymerase III subunit epsilon